MTDTRHYHGRAFVGGMIRENQRITVEDQIIASVEESGPQAGDVSIEGLLVPAFIDVHVHGGGGADFMDATPEAVETVLRFHAARGTGTVAATTLSADEATTLRAIRAIHTTRARRPFDGAEIGAVHFEGPYISPEKAGAQHPAAIRRPDLDEVRDWIAEAADCPILMTIAPETEGALQMIRELSDRIIFSIGHTSADHATAVAAIAAGARHFTHLFNAMPPLHHRRPGPVGAAMVSPATTVEIIADGHHLHPVILQTVVELMPERTVLVTDAIRAAGMPEGSYRLLDREITIAEGAARMPDGTLAGSTLTMMEAVRNMVELAAVPLSRVLPLATSIPATVLGLENRKGRIAAGYDADLLVLSDRLDLHRVMLRGREVLSG